MTGYIKLMQLSVQHVAYLSQLWSAVLKNGTYTRTRKCLSHLQQNRTAHNVAASMQQVMQTCGMVLNRLQGTLHATTCLQTSTMFDGCANTGPMS